MEIKLSQKMEIWENQTVVMTDVEFAVIHDQLIEMVGEASTIEEINFELNLDEYNVSYDYLAETEEYLSPADNDGEYTIELTFDDDNGRHYSTNKTDETTLKSIAEYYDVDDIYNYLTESHHNGQHKQVDEILEKCKSATDYDRGLFFDHLESFFCLSEVIHFVKRREV